MDVNYFVQIIMKTCVNDNDDVQMKIIFANNNYKQQIRMSILANDNYQ